MSCQREVYYAIYDSCRKNPAQFQCSREQNNNQRHATKQQSSRHESLKSFKTRNFLQSIQFQDMNSSSHSRQEACNNPYNSRRAKQISFCVCDQNNCYYIHDLPTYSIMPHGKYSNKWWNQSSTTTTSTTTTQCFFLLNFKFFHCGDKKIIIHTCLCHQKNVSMLPYFEEKNASEFAIFRYGFQ